MRIEVDTFSEEDIKWGIAHSFAEMSRPIAYVKLRDYEELYDKVQQLKESATPDLAKMIKDVGL